MERAKISLICTTYNEEASINELLDSLLSQSRLPDEIVIVDGGSTDQTVDLVSTYAKDSDLVTLLIEPGANIAQGRNIAIAKAKFDVLASIDGGCWADKHWLRNLIRPFEEDSNLDIVAGFFAPDARTEFEACLGEFMHPQFDAVGTEQFLPSSRSIAFRRECWQAVGGYPEWLYTGEDALFDLRLKDAGYKFAFAGDAIVHWRPRSNWRELYKQYYLYAKGAAEANIVSRTITKAYGGSVVTHVFEVLRSLVVRQRIKCLFYVFLFLPVIFVAKMAGLFSGKMGQLTKRNTGRNPAQAEK
jgi:glycosyltransferase involved in cell wall biosynthesis